VAVSHVARAIDLQATPTMALVAVAWFQEDGGLDELEHSTRLMNQVRSAWITFHDPLLTSSTRR
jgi:hypothetical protein